MAANLKAHPHFVLDFKLRSDEQDILIFSYVNYLFFKIISKCYLSSVFLKIYFEEKLFF